MGNRSLSKSGMFLIEMMISVLFFAICGGICLMIFVKAYQMSIESSDLTNALNVAGEGAECFKEDEELLVSLLGGTQISEGYYEIYYDKDWIMQSNQADNKYRMEIYISGERQLKKAVISVFRQDYQIYRVEVKKYHG